MHKGMFLSDAEYRAIPANAAAMIVESLKQYGIVLVQDGKPIGRGRDLLCGILAANADLLTVPWRESRFNENRKCETPDLDMGIQFIEP